MKPPASSDRTRIVTLLLFVLLGLLLINALFSAQNTAVVLDYPYSIDEVEGSTWASLDWMDAIGLYPAYRDFPYIPTSYPPLFYLATHALSFLVGPSLLAGRLVSLFATLGIALIAALLVHRLTRDRLVAAIAGLLFLVGSSALSWGTLYRVDALALLFTASGLLVASTDPPRRRTVVIAACLFLAAWFTKQTALFGGAIAAAWLLWRSRRPLDSKTPSTRFVLITIAATIGTALLLVLLLQQLTEGRYAENVFGLMSGITVFRSAPGLTLIALFWKSSALFVAAVLPLFLFERSALRRARPFVLFLGAGAIVVIVALVPMLLRSGSNANYFLRPHFLLVVLAALGLALVRAPRGQIAVVLLLIAATLAALPFPGNPMLHWSSTPWQTSAAYGEDRLVKDAVREKLCAVEGEVLSDDLAIPLSCGKRAIFEPFLLEELRLRQHWDPAPFLRDCVGGRYRRVAMSGRFHAVPFVRRCLTKAFEPLFVAETPKRVWDSTEWKVLAWKRP